MGMAQGNTDAFNLQLFAEETEGAEPADTSTEAPEQVETDATATAEGDATPGGEDVSTETSGGEDLLAAYKPTIPEGFELSDDTIQNFMPIAKELGINPEQADKLVALHCDMIKDLPQRIVEDINNTCEKTYGEFIDGVKSEMGKNFEKNMGQVNALLTKYGDKDTPTHLQAAMTALSGFAPDSVKPFFNALVKMSKDAADPDFHLGQATPQVKSDYPDVPQGIKFR